MDAKTYRVRTMREAVDLIRKELGPDASVLHTREINSGIVGWVTGSPRLS